MPKIGTKDQPIRVLLVDDDEDDFVLTRERLAESSRTFELDWKTSYEAGLEGICSDEYDAVLLDYKLGEKTGIELLTEARDRDCKTPVILLTGMSEPEIDLAAMRVGAADYLEKARIDGPVLDRTIRYAIQQKRIEAELERRVQARTEELNAANARLQDESVRKDEFLVTLAHELRNPLAPIRNALEILRFAGDKPQTVADVRAVMDRQVTQLVRLINDLLDVTRINRGKLRLTTERLLLAEVLELALEQSSPLLDKAGQKLVVSLPEQPVWLVGDRVRLAQVFANILNNSAKYSEPGGTVSLTATCKKSQVNVLIRDTGIGIPADKLPTIFEPFTQLHHSEDRSQGGLGIGLNLVKTLVELHEGRVDVRSDGPGQGTELLVILPCESE